MTHEAVIKTFLAKHGDQPMTYRAFVELQDGVTDLLAEQIGPLRKRIAALENEVRAGHERIKALEAGNEDG